MIRLDIASVCSLAQHIEYLCFEFFIIVPYKRNMYRDDTYKENSLLDVDGIPVAKDSNLRFRLRLVKNDKVKTEFKIIHDQIASTSQYLRFLNAIIHYKQNKFEEKINFDKDLPC